MTNKQKFQKIDQSKITSEQKQALGVLKTKTKNFTIKDEEFNAKVSATLDNIIKKLEETNSSAIKSSGAKKPKPTAMALAKSIRKPNESWKDAQARAREMMKKDNKAVTAIVKTELDKLTEFIKNHKKLEGLSGTDVRRDASRTAKPRGERRVTHSGETSNQYGTFSNKLGRKYYESRDRHSDRLAPKYPKNAPLLEAGGYMQNPNFGDFQNNVYKDGGVISIKDVKWANDENKKLGIWLLTSVDGSEILRKSKTADELEGNIMQYYHKKGSVAKMVYDENEDEGLSWVTFGDLFTEVKSVGNKKSYARGGGVTTHNGREYSLGRNWTNDHKHLNKAENHEVNYKRKRFELGGTVVADLAGHTGGSLGTGNPTMLSGVTGTHYSGLVGETGAMSSGEMFMNGGGLPTGAQQTYIIVDSFGNPMQHLAKGGGIRTHNGREYSLGRNWTNDHRHINKGQDYEVNYNRKGKFLGVFKEGGAIKNQYAGRTPQDIWDSLTVVQRKNFLVDHLNMDNNNDEWYEEKQGDLEQRKFKNLEYDYEDIVKEYSNCNWKKLTANIRKAFSDHVKLGEYARGGGVTTHNGREYSLGRNWTNDHKHLNKAENHEVKYKRKKFMAGGINNETPKIYVADLEAYNNGQLKGEWLDLANYSDADELMAEIQNLLTYWGVEEYAIHDTEYIPSSMYSEYMGKNDFVQLYKMMDLAKQHDLPLEVIEDVVNQYGEGAVDEFYGKYDSATDFAEQMVDDIGIENFNNPEMYMTISDTDRRLLAQDMADSYVDDIRDEDGGNRLIEEAGLDVSEYEDADSDRQQEMLDEAREIVYDEYYNTWFDGLDDPYHFLVEEQGMYSAEDFAKASFVMIDYDALARDLEQDYTMIEHDGSVYVFNIR